MNSIIEYLRESVINQLFTLNTFSNRLDDMEK